MGDDLERRGGNLPALGTPPRRVPAGVTCGRLLCGSKWFLVVLVWGLIFGPLPFGTGYAYFPLDPGRARSDEETLDQVPGVLVAGSLGALACAALGVRRGLKVLRLLRHGELAWATVTRRVLVATEDGSDTRLTLAFRPSGGGVVEFAEHEQDLVYHQTAPLAGSRVGGAVPVLYDPEGPQAYLLLWHQHPAIGVSPVGGWQGESCLGRALVVSASLLASAAYLAAGLFWHG
jgi:hypothetical protein